MPVLAEAKKPPAKTTPGTAYNQEYSGGSVGPIEQRLVQNNGIESHS